MTEQYTTDPFELELPWRIGDFAEVAVRPFDAGAVAAAAIAGPTVGGRWMGAREARWMPARSMRAVLTMVALTALLLATLLVVSLGGQQHPEVQTFHLGQLAYSESGDVYLANANGSDPRGLTHSVSDGRNYEVRGWYGNRLLYEGANSDPDGLNPSADTRTLLLFDATSLRTVELAALPAGYYVPVAGDAAGDRFAVMDEPQLTVITADGSTIARVSPPAGYDRWDLSDLHSLSFSSDGSVLIASACTARCMKGGDPGVENLFLVPLDGRPPQQLTTEQAPAWHASLSPDGSQIAFELVGPHDFDWSRNRLWIMGQDGADRRLLDAPPGVDFGGWSPSGKQILFSGRVEAFDDRNHPLWVIAARSGSSPVPLPSIAGAFQGGYQRLSWWPDGSKVVALTLPATASSPDAASELWAFPADGSRGQLLVPSLPPPGSRIYAGWLVSEDQ
jgi:hypothetical protein